MLHGLGWTGAALSNGSTVFLRAKIAIVTLGACCNSTQVSPSRSLAQRSRSLRDAMVRRPVSAVRVLSSARIVLIVLAKRC